MVLKSTKKANCILFITYSRIQKLYENNKVWRADYCMFLNQYIKVPFTKPS